MIPATNGTRPSISLDANNLEEVLKTPVNRLGLNLRGSAVESCIDNFHEELDSFRIRLRPVYYLSDGYGTCEGTANIGLAFWDVHETLKRIAHRFLGEYNTRADIMMLLRHEMGHAFCYSHKLYRRKEFRERFRVRGHFFNTYPSHDRFKKNPWSHDHVNPCGDHYAQKHPDDDFAETFATLLDPRVNWKRRYKHRKGALEKLYYVESLVDELGGKRTCVRNDMRKIYVPVHEINNSVRAFFLSQRARRN